jgi:hypothetical protein
MQQEVITITSTPNNSLENQLIQLIKNGYYICTAIPTPYCVVVVVTKLD